MRPLERVHCVVFDCDSTLSAIEGIDELGSAMREEIEALTDAAMRGELPLEAVYGRRLELIRPDRDSVERLASLYVERLVPDARETIAALRSCGLDVRVMSGGLRPAVLRVAEVLGIAGDAVAAVDVRFDDGGAYHGYATESPLAHSGGKRTLLQEWRAGYAARVMMVGDGVTDLEAAEAADVFVAYAGVVARDAVIRDADVVVRSASLAPILPLALGGSMPDEPAARTLFERGLALLDDDTRARLPNLKG